MNTLEDWCKEWIGEFIAHCMLLISEVDFDRTFFSTAPQGRSFFHEKISQYRY